MLLRRPPRRRVRSRRAPRRPTSQLRLRPRRRRLLVVRRHVPRRLDASTAENLSASDETSAAGRAGAVRRRRGRLPPRPPADAGRPPCAHAPPQPPARLRLLHRQTWAPPPRSLPLNVLDTGAPNDGVDVRLRQRRRARSAPTRPTTSSCCAASRSIPGEAKASGDRPAFVALLHGDARARRADADRRHDRDRPTAVERINYDAALNGRLIVYGLGGNDVFAVDDNSAITTLDGGAGNDTFQIGQIFGRQRDVAAGGLARRRRRLPECTIATTRGWLSPGIQRAAGRSGRHRQRRVHRLLEPGRAAARGRRRQRPLRRPRVRLRRCRHRRTATPPSERRRPRRRTATAIRRRADNGETPATADATSVADPLAVAGR